MSEPIYYFSNGTEGMAWQFAWCDRCLHDHQFRQGKGTGCPIFRDMLLAHGDPDYPPPPQIIEGPCDKGPESLWTCIEFKPYGWRKPGPPVPKPIPPGQGVLPFDESLTRIEVMV